MWKERFQSIPTARFKIDWFGDAGTGPVGHNESGKAEVLLTPGVFLRIGSNSSVKMVSPNLTNTEVAVEEGEATVEVTEIHKQNDIRIDADGVTTRLVKNGFYDF